MHISHFLYTRQYTCLYWFTDMYVHISFSNFVFNLVVKQDEISSYIYLCYLFVCLSSSLIWFFSSFILVIVSLLSLLFFFFRSLVYILLLSDREFLQLYFYLFLFSRAGKKEPDGFSRDVGTTTTWKTASPFS